MAIEIRMPALSPTMEEGTLAKWLVAEGDEVRSGDVIAEIETDKATMEVEAVDDGVVGTLLVAAGTENVRVNAPIAILLAEGEEAGAAIATTPEAAAAETWHTYSCTGPCTCVHIGTGWRGHCRRGTMGWRNGQYHRARGAA